MDDSVSRLTTALLIGPIAAVKHAVTSVVGVDALVTAGALELVHSAVVD